MSQRLPISGYQWVDATEQSHLFNVNTILKLDDESDIGYIYEVDLHYPESLHDAHNDFPFCAENRSVTDEDAKIISGGGTKSKMMKKLLLTLYDKENYVIHYKMLKLALRHGLILKKVHRILQFRQSAWLKPYIDFNTAKRTVATNEFDKSFFKMLKNAVFGKTMENLRLRVDIKLVSKWDGRYGARALISKPNFKCCKIFDEKLVAIELHNTHILMNKPIIVGMSILDLSKVTMYTFLYDFLKPKYGDHIQILYTDTDSFIMCIETEDFYKDMKNDLKMYDTSDYPMNNIYGIPRVNKKIPGLFKDELNSEIMTDFVGLRAKCYAVRSRGCEEKMKKAKGVKKNVLKREITFDDYIDCIKNNCTVVRTQNTIRSKMHNVYSIQQKKVALSPHDDKRYLIKPNNIDTYAWGHYDIDRQEWLHLLKNESIQMENGNNEIE